MFTIDTKTNWPNPHAGDDTETIKGKQLIESVYPTYFDVLLYEWTDSHEIRVISGTMSQWIFGILNLLPYIGCHGQDILQWLSSYTPTHLLGKPKNLALCTIVIRMTIQIIMYEYFF